MFSHPSVAQIKKEKKLRKGRKDGDVYAQTFGRFSGANPGTIRGNGNNNATTVTPNRTTRSPGKGTLACGIDTLSANREQQGPGVSTQSLAQWVRAVKPQQLAAVPPRNPRIHGRRMNSLGSLGNISEAGSRWENHGRLDSCAASAWGEVETSARDEVVHISDVESSAQCDDEDGSIGSSVGTALRSHGRGRSRSSGGLSRNEWNGLEHTLEFERSHALGMTASSTFFNHLEVSQWEEDGDGAAN